MPETKKGMIEGRLRKRLRHLNIQSYSEYCDYLFSKTGMEHELPNFIDVVTTNKTDFFREPSHFEFLVTKAVPELITSCGAGVERKVMVWSAAASTGNEAYTICMVLSEFASKYPGIKFDYSVLATDISEEVLEEAKRAVYTSDITAPIPMELRKKYLLKSKDKKKSQVRIVPKLRNKVKFRQLNLMDNDFKFREKMDIIFCRNVMIYFDKTTQDNLISHLCKYLKQGGYLFMGHSEILNNHSFPLITVAPAIYRKDI